LLAGGHPGYHHECADAQAQQQDEATDHQADDQAGAALARRRPRRERPGRWVLTRRVLARLRRVLARRWVLAGLRRVLARRLVSGGRRVRIGLRLAVRRLGWAVR